MAFVKFSRGLISDYNKLSRIDPDTLYLVYESTNAETGFLYLGTKLISSVGVSSVSLSDLTDISMPAELEDGMLLQYVSTTHKWEARPIADVLSNYEGSGGSSNIPVVDNLNNIENPSENDIAIQSTELFIYDGTQWQPLTVSDLENRVSELEEKVGVEGNTESGQVATGLYKKIDDLRDQLDAQIDSKIANAQHLRYQVVSSLDDIHLDNEEETKNTVFLVPKNDISTDDGYDEYLVDNGKLEKLGSWDADLTNYVQTTDNRLLNDEQKQKLDSLGYDSENHYATISTAQVGNLDQFVKDNGLIKTVQSGVLNVTPEGELQLVGIPTTVLNETVSPLIQSVVGNLSDLKDRVNENSTIVQEINEIKKSVIWEELTKNT